MGGGGGAADIDLTDPVFCIAFLGTAAAVGGVAIGCSATAAAGVVFSSAAGVTSPSGSSGPRSTFRAAASDGEGGAALGAVRGKKRNK